MLRVGQQSVFIFCIISKFVLSLSTQAQFLYLWYLQWSHLKNAHKKHVFLLLKSHKQGLQNVSDFSLTCSWRRSCCCFIIISWGVSFFLALSAAFLSFSLDPGGLYSWYLNFHTLAFWFFRCVGVKVVCLKWNLWKDQWNLNRILL